MSLDEYSCITKVSKVVHIPLPSSYIGNRVSGVLEVLEKWKCHYNTRLAGVLVSYSNVSFVSVAGSVLLDEPFIHYAIKADFCVFNPAVDSILKATINRISKEHIGCVVHNCINVSIHLSQNIASDIATFVAIDNDILFKVTQVTFHHRGIRVKGKITSECIDLMNKFLPNQRKNNHMFFCNDDKDVEDGNNSVSDTSMATSMSEPNTEVRKTKKKHKHKKKYDELGYSLNDTVPCETSDSDLPVASIATESQYSLSNEINSCGTELEHLTSNFVSNKRKRQRQESFNDTDVASTDLMSLDRSYNVPNKKIKTEQVVSDFPNFLDSFVEDNNSSVKNSNNLLRKTSTNNDSVSNLSNDFFNGDISGNQDLHIDKTSNIFNETLSFNLENCNKRANISQTSNSSSVKKKKDKTKASDKKSKSKLKEKQKKGKKEKSKVKQKKEKSKVKKKKETKKKSKNVKPKKKVKENKIVLDITTILPTIKKEIE